MADDKDPIPPHITPPPPLTPLGDLVAPPRAFVEAAAPRRAGRPEKVAAPTAPPAGPKDAVRDIVETVVFVVVLVLLLKTFIAEAFVIPTGSMATTLWGYQKVVTCDKCGETFPVNCSSEVDPQSGPPVPIVGCVCPNCRDVIHWKVVTEPDGRERVVGPAWNSGDRVLVSKFLYDVGLRPPERLDVVVFKFPGNENDPTSGPQKNHVAMNYIKRLIGKPGETIGVYYGNLYVAEGQHEPRATDDDGTPFGLRKPRYMERNDENDVKLLKRDAVRSKNGEPNREPRFRIVRKPPDQIMALSRLVYDNDHQASDLGKEFQRWLPATDKPGNAWKPDDAGGVESSKVFKHPAKPGSIDWLRYRHVLRTSPGADKNNPRPELITDFMGYNNGIPLQATPERAERNLGKTFEDANPPPTPNPNWVGDLILECEVQIDAPPADEDELWLELSKGVDRFQVRFQLKAGKIHLWRLSRNDQGGVRESKVVDAAAPSADPVRLTTRLRQPGKYKLRFANVDERLTLWIDNELPFGDGFGYDAPPSLGPDMPSENLTEKERETFQSNDLQPASIAVKGAAVTVSHIVLRRDTYYTTHGHSADASLSAEDWSTPTAWQSLQQLEPLTMYIQPRHYLCMGDNSPESADSREWGLVPDRLMLGRALMVYYPFYWPAWPFNNPENRIRMIR
jgi:signal peptidase I